MITFISLGYNCLPSYIILKGYTSHDGKQIKAFSNCSFPFDFIYTNLENIKNALINNFENWTDPKKIKIIEKDGKRITMHEDYPISGFKYYISAMWPNHDLSDLNILESMRRRVKRFKNLLKSKNEIVFVTTFEFEEFKESGLFDYFDYLPNKSYVFIKPDPEMPNNCTESGIIKNKVFYIKFFDPNRDLNLELLSKISKELYLLFKDQIDTGDVGWTESGIMANESLSRHMKECN